MDFPNDTKIVKKYYILFYEEFYFRSPPLFYSRNGEYRMSI